MADVGRGDGRWVGWSAVEPSSLDEVVLLGDGGRELVRLDLLSGSVLREQQHLADVLAGLDDGVRLARA